MFKEFKEFAMRGNVVDMAVGIIIGGAFGTIVKSLVADVLMPPIGLLLGGVDFSDLFVVFKAGTTPGPYATLADAQAAGAVTVNYGVFLNARDQLPDRGLRRLPVDPRDQRDAPQGRCRAGSADDQGVPALRVGDSDQGHPLPALHLAARRRVGRDGSGPSGGGQRRPVDGEAAHPLAAGREERAGHRGGDRRQGDLSHSFGAFAAGDEVDLHRRRLAHPQQPVVVEVLSTTRPPSTVIAPWRAETGRRSS